MQRTGASLAVIVAASLWGTTGTTAYFLEGQVSPIVIGAITMGVGGLILLIRGGRVSLALMVRPSTRTWVWLGGIGVVIYPMAFYQGMNLAGVAVGNIVALGSGPIAVAVLEKVVDKRQPGRSWLMATALALAGMVMLTVADPSATSAKPGGFLPGILLALLAGISYALFSYAMGAVMVAGSAPRHTVGAVFGAGSIPLLAVIVGAGVPVGVGADGALLLSYLVLGPMVLSYVLFSSALRVLTSSSVLTLALVEPAVATLLAIVVVGERFDLAGSIGLGLIFIAVVWAARGATVRGEPRQPILE
jgi:DME family drug/metabolite transporter